MAGPLKERTRYFIFVGSIVLVIIATQVIVQYDLRQQNLDAQLINQAGRQRMLSQRISKLILFLHYNLQHDETANQYSLDSLNKLIDEWDTKHHQLLALNREVVVSAKLDSLMSVNSKHIDRIVSVCRNVIIMPDEKTLLGAIDTLAKTELPFLMTMELAVNEYQYEAEQKLKLIKRVEIILSILAIIILIAEFIYIILPMHRALDYSNRRLRSTNIDLAASEEAGRAKLDQINALQHDLGEKHKQYKDLVDAASDMIYELDPIGNFSFVNPILEQKTGFSKNDLIGSPYWALLHINDRARVVAFYESQYASRDERSYLEFQIVTKDNSVLWVGQNVRMFFDNDELQKVSAVSRDITSIKSSEQALQAERILLRTIIDNIPINIYAKDTLSRKILANKAEYVFVGAMSEREVIGKTDFDLYPEFTARRSQEEDLLVFGGKNILNKETINTRKDGSFTWLLTSKVPLRDVEGTIIGLVGISIDITEQRLAQQKLERSEKLYRLVSENSQDVISLHKLDGVFEFITSSSITLHGYEPEELIGKNGLDFMHPDDAERIKNQAEENLVKMQNHEPLPPMQFRIASRHKGYIWVENLIKPIFESGKLIGFQSAVRNIAAQKLHEQALQEAKVKAEEATKAKTQFLSMMSHEIRTPLNGILGITNILLSENPRQDQLENLNLLKFSGENLLSIINDILDFSKVESGKMVLERIQFNLRELVDQTVRLLHDRAIRNGLDLRMNLDNDIPAFVMGDPVRLGQVLNNLLGNAIKFTERGFVEISIQVVERNEDRHHLRISIKDTGIGIPEDKLDTVFERFSQASPDTMRKYGGTGLGLSITKKILQLMNSEIHLTSRLGQGSEFSFDITFTESAEPITKIPEAVEHLQLSGNILLVEDNNVNQAVARKFLSKWGFTIVVAENGAEAVKAATSKAFDLILMDLHMPVMDGYEATRKIRSMGTLYFQDVPIIALTADVSREIKSNVKSSGMTDILEKPFKPGELYDILQKHLPGHAVEVPPEVAAKLSPYTGGDPVLEQELAVLITSNITEFKLAVIESLMQQNIHLLEASLHKNRTALHIVGDGTLNKLIDEIRTSLREHNGDIAQLIIQFSSQADLLIRAFNRSSNIK